MILEWLLFILNLIKNSYSLTCGMEINVKNDVTCHPKNGYNDLRSGDTTQFPENSIFFVETSCKGGLSLRQACSVESAAKAHPNRQVNVLFAGPVDRICLTYEHFKILLHYGNIHLYRIHIAEYSRGTPVEEWVSEHWNKVINKSYAAVSHTSDLLRYLTLYKFGGTYLDLDVVVARGFDQLPRPTNWVGRESDEHTGAGLISVSTHGVGKIFTTKMLRHVSGSFRPNCWSCNSVIGQKYVLDKICSNALITEMSAEKCQGFEVYPPQYFYPISARDTKLYYYPNQSLDAFKHAFAFHVWREINFTNEEVDITSIYGKLAGSFCPRIIKLAIYNRF